MASLVQAPIKLLKWLIVPESHQDNAEYFAEAEGLPTVIEYDNSGDRACFSQHHTANAASSLPKCKPTIIITRDGKKIPPRATSTERPVSYDDLNTSTHNHHSIIEDHCTQTTPTRRYTRSSCEHTSQCTPNTPLQLVSRIIQVPSERCLISPSGAVSDSFLPDKVVRIRRKERLQKKRFLDKLREREERERQKEMLRRCASISASYLSHTTANTEPSELTASNHHHHYSNNTKQNNRKQIGLLLRSGRQLKLDKPAAKTCTCCCCSQHFCHHKTHYLRGTRNPSCESVRRQ